MDDDKDPPIEPQEFLSGLKVVDFGDLRVARGLSRRPFSSCHHFSLVYDKSERRIWCRDCEKNVDPFDAFESIAINMNRAIKQYECIRDEAIAAKDHNLHLIAAKNIEKAWRGKTMAIGCRHCGGGLLPEDFVPIGSMCSAEIERMRRKTKK